MLRFFMNDLIIAWKVVQTKVLAWEGRLIILRLLNGVYYNTLLTGHVTILIKLKYQ